MNRINKWSSIVPVTVLSAVVAFAGLTGFGPGLEATPPSSTTKTDEELEDKYLRAVMLSQYGFYDEAARVCREILAVKPDQPAVTALLKQVESKKPQPDPRVSMRRRLQSTVVPDVSIKNGAVRDVLEFLSEQSQKHGKDREAVNFVVFIPEDAQVPTVTMSLKNATMMELVKYVTALTKLRYYIDANAVLIYHETMKPPMVPDETKPDVAP